MQRCRCDNRRLSKPVPERSTTNTDTEGETSIAGSQEFSANDLPSTSTPPPALADPAPKVIATTVKRKRKENPSTTQLWITPENLEEYVGPQAYQNDLIYGEPSPNGLSTVGYLGNGSSSDMPIEATVRSFMLYYIS